MPRVQYKGGHYERHSLTFGSKARVAELLEHGVVDAQALNFGTVQRLSSRLGLTEIDRAREEAERIGEETGRTPELYGRQIVEVVRVARAAQSRKKDEGLARRVEEERAKLYERMARSVGSVATSEAQMD